MTQSAFIWNMLRWGIIILVFIHSKERICIVYSKHYESKDSITFLALELKFDICIKLILNNCIFCYIIHALKLSSQITTKEGILPFLKCIFFIEIKLHKIRIFLWVYKRTKKMLLSSAGGTLIDRFNWLLSIN